MRLVLSLLACVWIVACGDDDAHVGEDSGSAGAGGADPGDRDGGAGGAGDASVPGDEDAGTCSSDADCSDGINCTGIESCDGGRCEPGTPPPCTPEHACIEATGKCDCSNPNKDGDRHYAKSCGGEDCDDTDFNIHPDATETCLYGGARIDEDCKPATIHDEATQDGDTDHDGRISVECSNLDPETAQRITGTDCDDAQELSYPGADEYCDYGDNDCDSVIDEGRVDGMGAVVPNGLAIPFYPDNDRDGYGDNDAEPMRRCEYDPPPGHVPFGPDDCDDGPGGEDVNGGETELCDGIDNDCDNLVDTADADDQPLLKPIEFTDTTVECLVPEGETKPRWVITDCPGEPGDPDEMLWCSDVVELGCTTEATSLASCRDCDNKCTFACGRTGCDEVTDLALGADHSCALTREGVVACWGYGFDGRLGYGEPVSRPSPTELLRIPQAHALGAGEDATCAALGDAHEVYCWGSNENAIVANPDVDDSYIPFPVPISGFDGPTLDGIADVAIGSKHACAVRATGALFCWGEAENGRLGNELFAQERIDFPMEVMREGGQPVDDAAVIAAGGHHSCLVTVDGYVDCWGDNSEGQLGDPSFAEPFSAVARRVTGLSEVDEVVTGGAHSCVRTNGDVLCWGLNTRGQLGRQTDADDGLPRLVEDVSSIVALAAGSTFTCAVDESGAVWCWGNNRAGQLGTADFVQTHVPQRVDVDGEVAALSAGESHACAATTDATYCWGSNRIGQLGLGQSSYDNVTAPERIQPLSR